MINLILNKVASEVDVSVVDGFITGDVAVDPCVEVPKVVELCEVGAEEVVGGGELKVVNGMVGEIVTVDGCVEASEIVDWMVEVLKVEKVVSDDKKVVS